ncbi:MAG: PHP domain-containing protein [Verrucomicrobia bacterium]|nr:PHP domain-containing protein [Verrucomicrobiota bacterium]
MAVRIDLHCHTFFSGDGVSSPEQLIAAARRKGLNGLAITDHNTCDAITYMLDKGLVRSDGLPVNDFLAVPGVEVTTAEGHLLCIGATLPNLKGHPAIEVCRRIHDAGGLAIPPHPYDLFRAGIRENVLDTLPIDALEVFNAATTLKRYNQMAFDYARRRNLPMTASSDAHHYAAVGTACTILDTTDFSVAGILAQIVKQNELSQRYLSVRDNIRKTWSNWMRLRKRKSLEELLQSDVPPENE